jgi:hypothetical protein
LRRGRGKDRRTLFTAKAEVRPDFSIGRDQMMPSAYALLQQRKRIEMGGWAIERVLQHHLQEMSKPATTEM